MWDLVLYLGITLAGYVAGDIAKRKNMTLNWSRKVQTFAISALVFTMGVRTGSNDEVVGKLDSIGVYAAVFTLVVMVCSAAAITLTRKLLGINRFGLREKKGNDADVKQSGKIKKKTGFKIDLMTILILAFVSLGIATGYIVFRRSVENMTAFNELLGTCIKIGLCTLLVFVGMDIGVEGKVVKQFKSVGIRIIAIPAAVIAGTLAGSLICGILLPISMRESMAIGAGLGWYSLAPGIIMDNGFVVAGAISFMHNVMRELFAILVIPIVAHYIGYVETVGLPGAASMDVCLPIVERSTSSATAVYSFVNGAVLSIAVPILVTAIIS